MCRMIVFSGECTRCGNAQTWFDLSQELSCLEAKNEGTFGECKRGVHVDEHEFDQECHRCTDEDEGIGGSDDELQVGDDLIYEFPDETHHELESDTPTIHGKRSADDLEDDFDDLNARRKKQKTDRKHSTSSNNDGLNTIVKA